MLMRNFELTFATEQREFFAIPKETSSALFTDENIALILARAAVKINPPGN